MTRQRWQPGSFAVPTGWTNVYATNLDGFIEIVPEGHVFLVIATSWTIVTDGTKQQTLMVLTDRGKIGWVYGFSMVLP